MFIFTVYDTLVHDLHCISISRLIILDVTTRIPFNSPSAANTLLPSPTPYARSPLADMLRPITKFSPRHAYLQQPASPTVNQQCVRDVPLAPVMYC